MELRLEADRLQALDAAVRRLLREGNDPAVRVIGAGEFTCVVAWDGRACKRLPPVSDRRRLERYDALLEEYLGALARTGVPTAPTEFQIAEDEAGMYVGYVLQPRLPRDELLPGILRSAPQSRALRDFEVILDHVDACVAAGIGIDPQISNWGSRGSDPVLLDVSTPMLRDENGKDRLDTEMFVSMLPVGVRGFVRRFMVDELLDKNFDHRKILLDLVGNVVNYGLDHLTEPFLDAANARIEEPISLREVAAYRREERWTWWVLRRAFAAEHLWRRHVRREPALHLLPALHAGAEARP